MKLSISLLLIAVAALSMFLPGCGKSGGQHHYVIVLDVSASIKRDSVRQAFESIDRLAERLNRGDSVTVIPITGDAETDSQGKVLRIDLPTKRQAYDNDLRRIRKEAKQQLMAMDAAATAHPGQRTDILGALEVAGQELNRTPQGSKSVLIVLSDFIQDDGRFNFARIDDVQVASKKLLSSEQCHIHAGQVFLGQLGSDEFGAFGERHRNVIKMFWRRFFSGCDADVRWETDGPSLPERVLRQKPAKFSEARLQD